MMDFVHNIADEPDAPASSEEVFWSSSHRCKRDAKYTQCLLMSMHCEAADEEWGPYAGPKMVHAFTSTLRQTYHLEHDVRWVGLVPSGGDRCAPDPESVDVWNSPYRVPREHVVVLVHESDVPKMSEEQLRWDSFKWFSDIMRPGDAAEWHFPMSFVQQYADPATEKYKKSTQRLYDATFPKRGPERTELERGRIVSRRDTYLTSVWKKNQKEDGAASEPPILRRYMADNPYNEYARAMRAHGVIMSQSESLRPERKVNTMHFRKCAIDKRPLIETPEDRREVHLCAIDELEGRARARQPELCRLARQLPPADCGLLPTSSIFDPRPTRA
jgi:hypothetical protein